MHVAACDLPVYEAERVSYLRGRVSRVKGTGPLDVGRRYAGQGHGRQMGTVHRWGRSAQCPAVQRGDGSGCPRGSVRAKREQGIGSGDAVPGGVDRHESEVLVLGG